MRWTRRSAVQKIGGDSKDNATETTDVRPIDLHQLADTARFNRFHALVLFWCALIIVFDGYDLAVVGIALPSIMAKMGVDATHAGFMVSSALFGMMFGAILLGTWRTASGAAGPSSSAWRCSASSPRGPAWRRGRCRSARCASSRGWASAE